jgi:regulator of nucleoside diphosphate kinase
MTNVSNIEHALRPPIVLTSSDHEQLRSLTITAIEQEPEVAHFLKQEIERAIVISPNAAIASSLVRMGSEVDFIDGQTDTIQRGRLVYPEQVNERADSISVLTWLGSALLGLGPGQTIEWVDSGNARQLTVLDVR